MSQFADYSVTLHVPDRDGQDDTQAAHDEALQPVDVWLQQHDAFHTIEQCGNDDRIENAKFCLSVDLLVPQDATETAKGLRGFADPGADLQVRATVFLNDTSQVLET